MRICPVCGAGHAVREWTCPACGQQPDCRDGVVYFAPAFSQGDGGDATYQHEALMQAEDAHFWFRARTKLLDVGCGRGALLAAMRRRFPSAMLAGAELLDAPLRLARTRLPDVDLYQMDARQLPFDREFDVVTSCDVLEHLDDDRAAARQLFRAVVPGGGLIVTVPQHQWLWSAVDMYSHHRRRYERRQLTAVIEQAGFVVERATSFVTALLPLVAMTRLRKAKLTPSFDPSAELKIGRVANRALENALDLERLMIRTGVSLPIGSSLLIVARRPRI